MKQSEKNDIFDIELLKDCEPYLETLEAIRQLNDSFKVLKKKSVQNAIYGKTNFPKIRSK